MSPHIRFAGKDVVLLLSSLAVLIPVLNVVPYFFAVPADVYSVAAHLGYNGKIAYIGVVAVCMLSLLAMYLGSPRFDSVLSHDPDPAAPPFRTRILEIAIVSAGVFLLYCPLFLARYGPYIEDNYYLSLLHRMEGGQAPYRDFEYLYGPMLLYPQHWWLSIFGYSMRSYYMFQAVMECVAYALLLWLLQRYYLDFKKRLIAFALLAVLLFNTVLAQNYNGLRRLVPVLVLVWIAERPKPWRVLAVASAVFGIWLAYSHELAIAGLAAASAVFAITWLREKDSGSLLRILAMWSIAIGTWFVIVTIVLGDLRESYFKATVFVLNRFTAGEQAFPFRWTLNSLALFGLLILGCGVAGKGLRARGALASGDRLMLAAIAYALVGLRAGLNRSDIWHLVPPILPLVFAFFLPLPRNVLRFSMNLQRIAVYAIVVLSSTYLLSLAPFGSFYARGLVRGFQDVVSGRKENVTFVTRAPSLEPERSYPDKDVRDLGEYLASPELRDRSVVFYSRLWALDKRAGVFARTYLPDDFFMTDDAGHSIARLVQKDKPIVVMQEIVYRHQFGEIGDAEYAKYLDRQPMTATKQLLAWVSTPFFRDLPLEWQLKEERWERTVAPALTNYRKETSFGPFVVLMPR